MYNKCGYFMSLKNEKKINVNIKFATKSLQTTYNKYSPFFSMCNEDAITQLFLEALIKNSAEEAKKYISKNFVDKIDLYELKDFFSDNVNYKKLTKIEFDNKIKKSKTNSILFVGGDNNSSIINLHMICEPDSFSKWKIYAIDMESEI